MDHSCANVLMTQNLAKLAIKLALRKQKKQKLPAISQDVFVLEQTKVQASKPLIVTFALPSFTPRKTVPINVTTQKLSLFKQMILAQHVHPLKNLPEENV